MPLDRDEYVEQAYFFQTLRERMQQEMSTQDLLDATGQEILTTTMLPLAVEFMAAELRLTGGFATAMARLPHYFTPFQTYVVGEAEKAEGRFDFRIALEPGFSPEILEELTDRGHKFIEKGPTYLFGGAQLIYRLENGYCAASDPRKDGQAVGW